jgi:hypothetical protein
METPTAQSALEPFDLFRHVTFSELELRSTQPGWAAGRIRRLLETQCLGSQADSHPTGARNSLDSHRRLRWSFRKFCSSQWSEACRTEWHSRCCPQLSSRRFRFPCPQRPHQRESGLPFIRQLRASGPACGYGLGEGQHRLMGRGPRQYHDCRAIGRSSQCESPPGIASKCRTIPPGCDGEWLRVESMENTRRGRVARQ